MHGQGQVAAPKLLRTLRIRAGPTGHDGSVCPPVRGARQFVRNYCEITLVSRDGLLGGMKRIWCRAEISIASTPNGGWGVSAKYSLRASFGAPRPFARRGLFDRGIRSVLSLTSASPDRTHCSPSADPFHKRTRLRSRIRAALPEDQYPTATHGNLALRKGR